MSRFIQTLALVVVVIVLSGCSSQVNDAPVMPGDTEESQVTANVAVDQNRTLWGLWECELDTSTFELNVIPSRSTMLHLNAVKPLNGSLGLGFTIDTVESNFLSGLVVLTVTINHPFPGTDNLSGFDVRGILVTTAGLMASGLKVPGENDPVLLNADGYTRWWNPQEFSTPGLLGYTPGLFGKDSPPSNPIKSAISPYKLFADGLGPEDDPAVLASIDLDDPAGRAVFRSGNSNSRKYEIQFPFGIGGPKIYFNYAIDASWNTPADDPLVIPSSFPSDANSIEAWHLELVEATSSLWNPMSSPQSAGSLDLTIKAYDWQGMIDGYDGEIGNLNIISPSCDFEIPFTPEIEYPGDGSAVLSASVPGIPYQDGDIPVWIGIEAPGTSYKQAPAAAPDVPVMAYTHATINVGEAGCIDNTSYDCNTAFDIGLVDEVEGRLCLNDDDRDWYAFSVAAGEWLQGSIELETYAMSDLDLYLYEGCPPELVDLSVTQSNADEELDLPGLTAGDYFIEVIVSNNGLTSPRPYMLTTALYPLGDDCTTDGNNTANYATPVEIGNPELGTVCKPDDPVDWFSFVVAEGMYATGVIGLENNNYADNDLAIYEKDSSIPIYLSELTGYVDEQIDIDLLIEGEYLAKVYANGDDPSGDRPFTLNLDLEEILIECNTNDGNNSSGDAEVIGLDDEASGTVCSPTDDDWYVFAVNDDAAEGMIILESAGLWDNNMYLYDDPDADPLYSKETSGTGNEVMEVDIGDGVFYLKVSAGQGVPGEDQDYTLITNLEEFEYGPLDFFIHAHIVRNSDGENPATTQSKVQSMVDWANSFYDEWIGGSVTLDQISYVDRTSWLSLTSNEAQTMFQQTGDNSGVLHIYLVNETPDMEGAAGYAMMWCSFSYQKCDSTYVVMNDAATSMVLAHEMGHSMGLLHDVYWLDWYTCSEVTYYMCGSGNWDPFCKTSDGNYGNLMYWPVSNNLNDYWISDQDINHNTSTFDSQAENIVYFHNHYPNAFHKP